mmetsp:Transcript_11058/g.41297  ORF Transcript_11058/g.41297 Transcript_11058/m.41297 type:complete len:206 (-) Transcript_11058:1001-1618(-)
MFTGADAEEPVVLEKTSAPKVYPVGVEEASPRDSSSSNAPLVKIHVAFTPSPRGENTDASMASFLPALILLPAVPRTVSICAPGVSTESTCTWHCCVSSRPVVDEAKRSSRATSQPMAAVVFRAIVRSARPKVGPSPMASSPRTQPDGFEVPGAEDADSSAVKEKEREMASRASVLVLGPRLGSYDALQSIAYSSEAPLAAAEMV